MNLPKHFKLSLTTKADEKAVVSGKNYRFTILTPCLIRMEYSPEGLFEDRATQTVFNRVFEVPQYEVTEENDTLIIKTSEVEIHYKKGQPFQRFTLWAGLRGANARYENRWYYGDAPVTLKGTARTLDRVNGETELSEGLISQKGYSILDDSASLVLTEEGWVEPRKEDICDLYFFGYAYNYINCIKDFYRLTGAPPLLPKYALGNWWSRYHAYTEEEYKTLIERFEREDIPFSVAVIDMDWHIVDLPGGLGKTGWTGYTWNKDLFPDYKGFLKWLHKHNLKVSLNLHPADGVRSHEEMYDKMAKAMDIDPATKEPVKFDVTDKKFMAEYFKILHHPYENDGVDFWWMDWQQGKATTIKGLDSLWMLNHFHTLDIARDGKRPLLFSRYSGPGSHRYPVGFSGDTHITWESLKFQPYFTATASNVGYSWWSHDIGGHFHGYRDDELTARWLQFGVFSPINRLHSSISRFTSREPWKFNKITECCMKKFLRLRKQLIPYIYTMSYRNHKELLPLIMPMYYPYPKERNAYNVKTQYIFGSQMMVAPITDKSDDVTTLGSVAVWLPKGNWVDFFTGVVYSGDRMVNMYRNIYEMPVLCKTGAIVPMASHTPYDNSITNQAAMEVRVFAGDNGSFTLYEDEGDNNDYLNGKFVTTNMTLNWGNSAKFTIDTPDGDISLLPENRQWTVHLVGFNKKIKVSAKIAGNKIEADSYYDSESHSTVVSLPTGKVTDKIELEVKADTLLFDNSDYLERCEEILLAAHYDHDLKDRIYNELEKDCGILQKLSAIVPYCTDKNLYDALLEVLSAI